jgi:hypothetical protein
MKKVKKVKEQIPEPKVIKKVKKVVVPEPEPEKIVKVVKKVKKVVVPEPEVIKKSKILKSKTGGKLIPNIELDYLYLKEDASGNIVIDDEKLHKSIDLKLDGSKTKNQVVHYFHEPPEEGWGAGHSYYQHKPEKLYSAIIEAKVKGVRTGKKTGIYQYSECETYIYTKDK